MQGARLKTLQVSQRLLQKFVPQINLWGIGVRYGFWRSLNVIPRVDPKMEVRPLKSYLVIVFLLFVSANVCAADFSPGEEVQTRYFKGIVIEKVDDHRYRVVALESPHTIAIFNDNELGGLDKVASSPTAQSSDSSNSTPTRPEWSGVSGGRVSGYTTHVPIVVTPSGGLAFGKSYRTPNYSPILVLP